MRFAQTVGVPAMTAEQCVSWKSFESGNSAIWSIVMLVARAAEKINDAHGAGHARFLIPELRVEPQRQIEQREPQQHRREGIQQIC